MVFQSRSDEGHSQAGAWERGAVCVSCHSQLDWESIFKLSESGWPGSKDFQDMVFQSRSDGKTFPSRSLGTR
jgi:hypothetical protein